MSAAPATPPPLPATVDVLIVGAGMAGASLAAAVAPRASVLLVEAEDRPAFHATGRSAAFWTETYGGPAIQPLTSASGPALSELGVLSPRGALTIARAADVASLDAFAAKFARSGIDLRRADRGSLAALVPGLRPEWMAGIQEPSCADIDVAALHARDLADARRAGAALRTGFPVERVSREGGRWRLEGSGGAVRAAVLANAAGAWADPLAVLAGVLPAGVRPLRRTVVQLRVAPAAPVDLPLVLDVAGGFYFKPSGAGRVWLSPNDETPAYPGDAAAEELDVALAVDRFGRAVDWRVEAVERRWAGLRSFAPDRLPVYGFDPAVPSFFWCAGQGGFGIQTAPAAAALAAVLLLGEGEPPVDPAPYLVDRLR